MADVQIAVIDTTENEVNVAVPGVQGPIGSVAIAQDGTATEPGIRFESDTNTGIYRPGADQLAISTGGTGRLFVASDGKMGIGTSSPGGLLHCAIGTSFSPGGNWDSGTAVFGGSTNNGSAFGIAHDTTNGTRLMSIQPGAAWRPLELLSNGVIFKPDGANERARIDSSGRFLVGTSTAYGTAFTQIQGSSDNATDPGSIFLRRGYTSTEIAGFLGTELGLIDFGSKDGGVGAKISSASDGTWSSTSDCPSRLVFATTADGAATPTERLRITSTGNVGIGTTSPGEQLSIAGAASVYASLTSSGGVKNSLNASDVTGCGAVGTVTNHPLRLETNNLERARIDSSGRLLVGTSSAVTTLISAGLQVQSTGANAYTSIGRWDNNTANPGLIFNKSRGGSVGALGIVQSGDSLGEITFTGDDGSAFVSAARIQVQVDGTPGTNDMPGSLAFSTTADGAATPTERLRITSAGVLQVADAGNIAVGTTTGTKIGTATTQKLGFYDATPVVQPTAVADATDAATVITQLNALLTRMRNLGLIAT
jgi:hypothetical protein